jgi:hypothetical protein
MECYFCKRSLDDADIADVVPLKREGEIIYACSRHHGVLEEYSRQFDGAIKDMRSAATGTQQAACVNNRSPVGDRL